jgi:hypothetical protein
MDYSLNINLDKYNLGKIYYRQGKKMSHFKKGAKDSADIVVYGESNLSMVAESSATNDNED